MIKIVLCVVVFGLILLNSQREEKDSFHKNNKPGMHEEKDEYGYYDQPAKEEKRVFPEGIEFWSHF